MNQARWSSGSHSRSEGGIKKACSRPHPMKFWGMAEIVFATPDGAGGESPGGVAPPGARRTRRERLRSPGSHRPAVGAHAEPPVGEQVRLASCDVSQEPARSGGAAAQPLELPHGPANEVFVDPSEKPDQLGAVEAPVIVDPPLDDHVDRPRQVREGLVRPAVQAPAADLPPDSLARLA